MSDIKKFKNEIAKLNNKINEEMYGRALDWQKIDIIGNKIIIIGLNRRVFILRNVDKRDIITTRLMDHALINEFKMRFRSCLEKKFQIKVRTVFKDYDPAHQLASLVVLTEEPIEDLLKTSNN